MATDFFAAGASAFICKPMPANETTLREVLHELLCKDSFEQAPARQYRPGKGASLVITPHR